MCQSSYKATDQAVPETIVLPTQACEACPHAEHAGHLVKPPGPLLRECNPSLLLAQTIHPQEYQDAKSRTDPGLEENPLRYILSSTMITCK